MGIRRFIAIATWHAPSPLRIEAVTVRELRELMREAENGAVVSVEPSWTWVA
ncbi:hypothetical protein AB0M95_23800 [Sphaerisporangium sp. NPDC051017]|uniref:hypothetical protein n=1 Tax=Sphaerisporangium sp. NPDC051017 TaxID=3154636 RepID=UPI00342A8B42